MNLYRLDDTDPLDPLDTPENEPLLAQVAGIIAQETALAEQRREIKRTLAARRRVRFDEIKQESIERGDLAALLARGIAAAAAIPDDKPEPPHHLTPEERLSEGTLTLVVRREGQRDDSTVWMMVGGLSGEMPGEGWVSWPHADEVRAALVTLLGNGARERIDTWNNGDVSLRVKRRDVLRFRP